MREIIYRAKAINRDKGYHRTRYKNGDWVYGLVTRLYDERFENVPAEMKDLNGVSGIEVDYKTIGQYTGLTDKNGKKVFEGDILSAHFDESYPDDETLLLVGNNGYAFTLKEEDSEPEMIENSDMRFFDEIFVVIGNVHDNSLEDFYGR